MNHCPNICKWGAVLLLVAVSAGCNSARPAADQLPGTSTSAPRFGQVASPPVQQPEKLEAGKPSQLAADAQESAKPVEANLTPDMPAPSTPAGAAGTTDKKVQTSSNPTPSETSKQPSETSESTYDAKKPSLMGLRLSDTKTTVKQKFEAPASEYEMDDDKDPLTVYEYEGFIVGFNRLNGVEFIEVTSKDINPGLNGLYLGQKVKDAETALGKPDTNTNYALHYKANGTVLKLDVDPKTETIQSIKLFAVKT
ncbi:DUF4309 domain-containing protein [Paenibacillus ginsengarvi]|uniref:DUF4309 domain-containing protein n=1 Tax=Paenibacillus ginsengarvi TaxID=400777 RepID=A0A3B0CIP1_9BACL|nr:DUF4309 domain-containing protein [Paenibacillus ginsengarvi]RKN85062.1 DUF4309 domain-containing protein [Paenibacillus ginsengarvi]